MTRVLVVDDSLFMRNQLERLLSERGYDTIVAEDGAQAVDSYRQDSPDLVVLDITMPHKDGLEALFEIRQHDPEARVVMLTALDQQVAAARAVHLGAKDFLVKPVPPQELITALERALRYFRENDVNIVNFLTVKGHPLIENLRGFGFLDSGVKINMYVPTRDQHPAVEALTSREVQPGNVHIAWGDYDALPVANRHY